MRLRRPNSTQTTGSRIALSRTYRAEMTRLVFADKEPNSSSIPRAGRNPTRRCSASVPPRTGPLCTLAHLEDITSAWVHCSARRAWRDSLRVGAATPGATPTNSAPIPTPASDPRGPELPSALVITGDTQMMLALARALHSANSKPRDTLRADIVGEFVTWRADRQQPRPRHHLHPATGALAAGHDWTEATVPGSDGCGTVMRVSPTAYGPSDCGDRSRPGRPRSPTAPPPASPRRC